MADDDSYSSFLDKANQDTGASKGKEGAKSQGVSTLVNTDADLPKHIKDVHGQEVMYVSESDEPFEGVSLKMDGDGKELFSLCTAPAPESFRMAIRYLQELLSTSHLGRHKLILSRYLHRSQSSSQEAIWRWRGRKHVSEGIRSKRSVQGSHCCGQESRRGGQGV